MNRTSTKQRSSLGRIHVLWNTDSSFRTNGSVLTVPAVAEDTVNSLVIAHLEPAPVASTAIAIMATVPCSAYTIALLPLLLPGSRGNYVAYVLMAEKFDLAVLLSVHMKSMWQELGTYGGPISPFKT